MGLAILGGCEDNAPAEDTAPVAAAASPDAEPAQEPYEDLSPLVVGYSQFSGEFSPFFYDAASDEKVVMMTSGQLLTVDRQGDIIYDAASGQTRAYSGTDYIYYGPADVEVSYDEGLDRTTYLWTLREDIRFSDGEYLDADDVIFSYYVYLDPSYDGACAMYTVPIVGLTEYRTQTTTELYDKYSAVFDEAAAGHGEYAESAGEILEQVWIQDVQAIVDYVMDNYTGFSEVYFGYTEQEVLEREELQVAFGMIMWAFGDFNDNGYFEGGVSGRTWNLETSFPTIGDFYNEIYLKYGGDSVQYWSYENNGAVDDSDVYETARSRFIQEMGAEDGSLGGGDGIESIEGIKKLGDYQVEVTVEGYDASAIYLLGCYIAPLHYYGDESLYDYDASRFGFEYGELSAVKEKSGQPVGFGPYSLVECADGVIYFESNEYYYLGAPKIGQVQFLEITGGRKVSGIADGTIDIADMSFSEDAENEILGYNSNGELTGDVITADITDSLGYGYIGINAQTVNVGGSAGSEASKNLRRAFASLFAVYRDEAVSAYYGDTAEIIEYPITSVSWAAPQFGEADYITAFSAASDGSAIYSDAMDNQARYEAALNAAVDYLIAAGYEFDEEQGVFTSAPDGAGLEYEVLITAGGTGDHPAYLIVEKAARALEGVGITLTITDDSALMWEKIEAGEHQIWCAAWQSMIDPDMYRNYHSSNTVESVGSTQSNYYGIKDSSLDELIISARSSSDETYRKALYKSCLDIVMDWAVEVPVYQRQNCVLFGSASVNAETRAQDTTAYYSWLSEIHLLEMTAE